MQETFFFRRFINLDKTDRDVMYIISPSSSLKHNMHLQRIQEISGKLSSRESAWKMASLKGKLVIFEQSPHLGLLKERRKTMARCALSMSAETWCMIICVSGNSLCLSVVLTRWNRTSHRAATARCGNRYARTRSCTRRTVWFTRCSKRIESRNTFNFWRVQI